MSGVLPTGHRFVPMTIADIADVLALIATHSDEDAEGAAETYDESVQGHFVLKDREHVVGVTGYQPIHGTDRAYWLSWTYLSSTVSLPLQGGAVLLSELVAQLRNAGGRKLFAMVSPRLDTSLCRLCERDGAQPYLHFGFQREATHLDYYAPGESLEVLGFHLSQPDVGTPIVAEDRGMRIIDADEIAETDDAYYLDWRYTDGVATEQDQMALVDSVQPWCDQIRDWEGRMVYISLPSTAEHLSEALRSAGFAVEGQLRDFYRDGIDELRLRLDL